MSSCEITSSTDGPLLAKDVDISRVEYSDVQSSKGNSTFRSAYVNYGGDNKLVVQTPWLFTWDGISEPPEEYRQPGAPPKYSINFSLRGHKDNAEVQAFLKMLNDLDEKILHDASTTHSQAWLKKKTMSKDVCEALYTKQVKLAKDRDTGEFTDQLPPSFKAKVPYYDGVYKCMLFDQARNEITENFHEHLTGRCQVRAILRCTSVWFAGGKFGVSWQVQQCEYIPDASQMRSYGFRQTAEDAQRPALPAPAQAQAQAPEAKAAPDDDEEDIDDSDIE